MLSGVRHVALYISDQDAAKTFWTETMGFEVINDIPMGENGERWIEVTPPSKNVIVVLFTPPEQRDRIGQFANVMFTCEDIHKTHEELTARGVHFPEPPVQQFWGWWAVFQDPDGNSYGLGESGE